jgi:hypothetical protein
VDTIRLERWTRTHRTSPAITLTALTSPIDRQYVVHSDGWQLPVYFPLIYSSLEAAQRAADDVLLNSRPHDCWRCE